MTSFTEDAKKLFEKARVVDTRFFRRLSELGESLEEAPFGETEDEKSSPVDNESIAALITQCHDSHQVGRKRTRIIVGLENLCVFPQDHLLSEATKLEMSIQKWKKDFLDQFRRRERKRNRNRVLELNHFLDTVKQEEEEMEIIASVGDQLE